MIQQNLMGIYFSINLMMDQFQMIRKGDLIFYNRQQEIFIIAQNEY
ncbi:unnamed protein product [Paramecium primaurelia]|uniref:Uncharacterized protein n=1 Tax=Paramecium primaurelia TaxID=5886 RepID=A0A8S1NSE5_PARPR|nr:unnamed protein product [Paramecium primaurelia]